MEEIGSRAGKIKKEGDLGKAVILATQCLLRVSVSHDSILNPVTGQCSYLWRDSVSMLR